MMEVIVLLAMAAGILSIVMANGLERIQLAQFQKTVLEMKAIAEASIDFYVSQGTCPSGTNQLVPSYMPQTVTSSPFNTVYRINCGSNFVSVSNMIPTGIAQKNPEGSLLQINTADGQDNITITEAVSYQYTGRLQYAKISQ